METLVVLRVGSLRFLGRVLLDVLCFVEGSSLRDRGLALCRDVVVPDLVGCLWLLVMALCRVWLLVPLLVSSRRLAVLALFRVPLLVLVLAGSILIIIMALCRGLAVPRLAEGSLRVR